MFKVGDTVIRIIPPYDNSTFGAAIYRGIVTEVHTNFVKCDIFVDVVRTMRFDNKNGINVNGLDYGFIVPGKDVSWILEE